VTEASTEQVGAAVREPSVRQLARHGHDRATMRVLDLVDHDDLLERLVEGPAEEELNNQRDDVFLGHQQQAIALFQLERVERD